MNITITTNK